MLPAPVVRKMVVAAAAVVADVLERVQTAKQYKKHTCTESGGVDGSGVDGSGDWRWPIGDEHKKKQDDECCSGMSGDALTTIIEDVKHDKCKKTKTHCEEF